MRIDRFLIAKILSSAMCLSVIFIGLDSMRRELPPPPILVWALAIYLVFEGWIIMSTIIREAELDYRESKKIEEYLSMREHLSRKYSLNPIIWDDAGYWIPSGLRQGKSSQLWKKYLARSDGLVGWEYAQEWFFDV